MKTATDVAKESARVEEILEALTWFGQANPVLTRELAEILHEEFCQWCAEQATKSQ